MKRCFLCALVALGICVLPTVATGTPAPAASSAASLKQNQLEAEIKTTLEEYAENLNMRRKDAFGRFVPRFRRLAEAGEASGVGGDLLYKVLGNYRQCLEESAGHAWARQMMRPHLEWLRARITAQDAQPLRTPKQAAERADLFTCYARSIRHHDDAQLTNVYETGRAAALVPEILKRANQYGRYIGRSTEGFSVRSILVLLNEGWAALTRHARECYRSGRLAEAAALYDRASGVVLRALQLAWGQENGRPASPQECWDALNAFAREDLEGCYPPANEQPWREEAFHAIRDWIRGRIQEAETYSNLLRKAQAQWLLTYWDYYAVQRGVGATFDLAIFEANGAVQAGAKVPEGADKRTAERAALGLLGVVSGRGRDPTGARDAWQRVIDLDKHEVTSERVEHHRFALTQLVEAELSLGLLREAKKHLDECEAIPLPQGAQRDTGAEEWRHAARASLNLILGDTKAAKKEYFELVKPSAQQQGARFALYELPLGKLFDSDYRAGGDKDHRAEAIRHYQRARLGIIDPDRWLQQAGWEAEARLLALQGKRHAALVAWRRAEAAAEKQQTPEDLAWIRLEIGRLLLRSPNRADLLRAYGLFNACLRYAEVALNPALRWQSLLGRGEARVELGDPKGALADFESAAKIAETLRMNNDFSSQDRARMLPEAGEIYQQAALLELKRRNVLEAYDWARRYKGQELRRRVNGAPDMGELAAAKAGTLERATEVEREARRVAGQIEGERFDLPLRASHAKVDWQLGAARRRHRQAVEALQATVAQLLEVKTPVPVTLPQLAELARQKSIILADYLVTENELFIFVLDNQGKLTYRQRSVPRADLAGAVDRMLTECTSDDGRPPAASADLYRELIDPLRDFLQSGQSLVVVPDGPLHRVPWDALVVTEKPRRYLVEERTVTPQASAGTYYNAETRRTGPGNATVLARSYGALPVTAQFSLRGSRRWDPLPYALQEGASAARDLSARFFTERRADPARFLGAVTGEETWQRVVWYVGHAGYEASRPLDSGLVFDPKAGDAGKVTVRHLLAARHGPRSGPDLVVLSGCESAQGQAAAGEGLTGLVWALQLLGTRSVVGCQWKVEDQATAELMGLFARKLRTAKNRAEALREAKLEVMRRPGFMHPKFWAAPVLMGSIDPLGPIQPPPGSAGVPWAAALAGLTVAVLALGGVALWRHRRGAVAEAAVRAAHRP